MDKKLKEKWVKALTSGRYTQVAGNLRYYDRYCCLGVLREIADPKDTGEFFGLLTQNQLEKFGLSYSEQCALARLNDFSAPGNDGTLELIPFDMIAGFIQENL